MSHCVRLCEHVYECVFVCICVYLWRCTCTCKFVHRDTFECICIHMGVGVIVFTVQIMHSEMRCLLPLYACGVM